MRREITVVGGGLAGSAMALALAKAGFDTVQVAPPNEGDQRSTAVIGPSVGFLEQLGLAATLRDKAAPLKTMRLIDDTGGLFRAPTVEFRASEIGLEAFGYNILNRDLLAALDSQARDEPKLERLETSVTALRTEGDIAIVELADGRSIRTDLIVGADGRASTVRELSGISVRSWRYPQTALVTNFEHSIGHRDVSTEFHTRSGPFTQVPMKDGRSSLVWVEDPKLADLFRDLERERLNRIVEDKMHSILGRITVTDRVQAFPLSGSLANRVTGPRIALVGEAAHAFPPIGAQGLNLGLRDCAALLKAVSGSRDDPGRAATLGRYEAARRVDIGSRTAGVDLLNRSLLAGMLPVQMLRASGLGLLRGSSFLRRFAMREGMAPGAGFFGLGRSAGKGIGRKNAGLEGVEDRGHRDH